MQIRSKRAWPGSRDLLLKFWNSFNFSGMAKVTKLKFGVQLAISVWMKRHTRYRTLFLELTSPLVPSIHSSSFSLRFPRPCPTRLFPFLPLLFPSFSSCLLLNSTRRSRGALWAISGVPDREHYCGTLQALKTRLYWQQRWYFCVIVPQVCVYICTYSLRTALFLYRTAHWETLLLRKWKRVVEFYEIFLHFETFAIRDDRNRVLMPEERRRWMTNVFSLKISLLSHSFFSTPVNSVDSSLNLLYRLHLSVSCGRLNIHSTTMKLTLFHWQH